MRLSASPSSSVKSQNFRSCGDKRLAKMANRSLGKKAKDSVKGTPSHNSITFPVKTVVTPGSVVVNCSPREA